MDTMGLPLLTAFILLALGHGVPATKRHEPFVCWNHTVIERRQVCDGVRDCAQGEDEQEAGGCVRCPGDGTILSPFRLCDGVADCTDGSDELLATCRRHGCHQGPERCKGNPGFDLGAARTLPDVRAEPTEGPILFSTSLPTSSQTADVPILTSGDGTDSGDRDVAIATSTTNPPLPTTDTDIEVTSTDVSTTSSTRTDKTYADPCLDVLCDHGGTCISGGDEFTCLCVNGYVGPLCQHEYSVGGFSKTLAGPLDYAEITSPAYPAAYPPYSTWTWIFTAQPNQQVKIVFNAFKLEGVSGEDCPYDSVVLKDNATTIGAFCGSHLPGGSLGYVAMSGLLHVVFTSYHTSNEHMGFLAIISQNGLELSFTPVPGSLPNQAGRFTCSNGQEVALGATCDGQNDCGDQSDEHPHTAGCEDVWECRDGGTTYEYNYCDGVCQCDDCSDEAQCSALFVCGDGRWVPRSYLCDGERDCTDGEDEGQQAGCEVDPCVSAPCTNGGTCTVDGASFTCQCDQMWAGATCNKDVDDACVSSPCENGGTCIDGVDTYYCSCPDGYHGHCCQQEVGTSGGFAVLVDRLGTDNATCGNHPAQPCSTLEFAIARARAGSSILVEASALSTGLSFTAPILTKSLTVRGVRRAANDSLPRLTMTTTLLGTPTRPVNLRLQGVHFSGTLGLGDATVSVSDSTLEDATLGQEAVRRAPSHQVAYELDGVLVRNSTFTVGPGEGAGEAGGGQNVYSASFSLVNAHVVDTVVDLRAVRATVRLQGVNFSSSVLSTSDPGGGQGREQQQRGRLTMHLGYRANPSDLFTPTLTTTRTVAARPTRRRRSGSSPRPPAGKSSISIVDTSFSGLAQFGGPHSQQAAVSLRASDSFTFLLKRSNFTANKRAVHLEARQGMRQGSLFITQCVFHGNEARGPGGAVHVEQAAGELSVQVQQCTFSNNVAFSLPASQNLSQTRISKITGSGGAVAISLQARQQDASTRSSADISHCTFVNNTSENYGGSVYFTSGVLANLYANTFSNVVTNTTRPRIGDILESRGNLLMHNNTFRVATSMDEVPILSYRAERDGQFLQSESLDFICPKGYQASTVYNAVKTTGGGKAPIETLLMYCQSCSEGLYSLAQSHVLLNQSAQLDLQPVATSRCAPCPYGAMCRTNVLAKANFWGEVAEGRVHMYLCPADYCCQEAVCTRYDQCAENREGPLCGRCRPGYSESLFSTACVPNHLCSYATWFWVVIALYGIGYVAFFVFQQEVTMVTGNFSGWLAKHLTNLGSRCQGARKDNKGPSESAVGMGQGAPDGAYLQIFMYYVQSAELLKISILYLGNREMPLEGLSNSLKNVFSFNSFGINTSMCLFKDVTAVFKTLLNVGFVVYLFLVWALFLVIGKLLNVCVRRAAATNKASWVTPTPFGAKLTGALVLLALYTYQYFAENSFVLLRCVWVHSVGGPVLYVDGQVQCYTDWQYAVLAFTVIYVLPFFSVLLLGPSLLRHRVLSVREFLLSLFLPLLACPFLLLLACRTARLQREGRPVSAGPQTAGTGVGSVDTVVGFIAEPYRSDLPLGLCWEGVIALRRLLLVVAATLITNVLLRHLVLVGLCYLSLATHVRLRPFVQPSSNSLEAGSLGVLLTIGIMNLLKAAYFEAGEVPAGSANLVFRVYDWLEAVLLGVLPLAIATFVALALLLRVGTYLIMRACGRTVAGGGQQGKGIPPLDTGDVYYSGRAPPTYQKSASPSAHQVEPVGPPVPPSEPHTHYVPPREPLGGDTRCRTRTTLTPEQSFFDPPLGTGRARGPPPAL